MGVEEKGNQFIVSVTDTGVGMSPAAMQKLFLLGTKHSTLGTAQEKGTGLGLILCKEFVEKHCRSCARLKKWGTGGNTTWVVQSRWGMRGPGDLAFRVGMGGKLPDPHRSAGIR